MKFILIRTFLSFIFLRCKDFETQAPLYSLKKWFGEYGKDYIQEGIIGFSRHCSRHSTGKAPQFRATALKFKSNSDIHQAIMKFIPANNFGELVPYGINEAKSIGEMFQIYFGKLFKSLEPQQVKFTSSEIKRSRDTGLYFYEGAFKHFKNPANIATVSHLRQGDALLKPHLPHPIVVSKYDDLMNQIVLPRIAHQLKANEKLDHKDLGRLMNLWSISSGMQKKNVFAETFTTEEEQSILVEYKETKVILNFLKVGLNACNFTIIQMKFFCYVTLKKIKLFKSILKKNFFKYL